MLITLFIIKVSGCDLLYMEYGCFIDILDNIIIGFIYEFSYFIFLICSCF